MKGAAYLFLSPPLSLSLNHDPAGLESTLDGIDAPVITGYGVYHNKEAVELPYPGTWTGRSFHHGRFIQNLRAAARAENLVDIREVWTGWFYFPFFL